MTPRKSRIVFLNVPESLRGEAAPENGYGDQAGGEAEFFIDPAIPIPVEITGDGFNLEDLSSEMILSGMIKVIGEGAGEPAPGRTQRLPEGTEVLTPERIGYYRRFVRALRPGILHEFTGAAILKAKEGDFDTALEILDSLGALYPGHGAVLLNQALVREERAARLERQGREEAAEAESDAAAKIYQELLGLDPPLAAAVFNAGFFFMGRRDFSRARHCFSRYIALDGEGEKAEKAGEMLKEIAAGSLEDEDYQEAWEHIRRGEEVEGMGKVRSFIEAHPRSWQGWFLLGWALRKLRRWEDGEAAFRKAIEFGGGNGDTRNELAICLMEEGRTAEARRELETALRQEPENIKIISNLGVLALKNGSGEEAAAFFRTVLEIEPGDPVAAAFLSRDEV
ncbi:MAG: tetratricopeptide repeat protein [Treponema sp.]|jgi:Flp pilus assembly protein TadD|nr:tetratricopeptide repeat protein [Treponema sp.]